MAHALLALGSDSMPTSGNVLEPAARTVTTTTDDIGTLGATGLIVVINATAKAATPSVVFKVQGVVYPNPNAGDKGTAVTWDILSSVAVTDVGTTVLQISPNVPDDANKCAQALVPDRIRIVATPGDTDSLTYSVTAVLTA